MKIYIAGKIAGDETYREKFSRAAMRFKNQGHVVLNPAELPEGMTPSDYMRICFAMIDVADRVVLLPDYIASKGAMLEMDYCSYTHKPWTVLDDTGQAETEERLWPYFMTDNYIGLTLAQHIYQAMDLDEIYAQLAEEAAELAHAALKMRRVLNGKNPTPVDPDDAFDYLLEEINDVFAVLDVLNLKRDAGRVRDKLERWKDRIADAGRVKG